MGHGHVEKASGMVPYYSSHIDFQSYDIFLTYWRTFPIFLSITNFGVSIET